jgi:uncharacterized protein YkwD
VRCVVVIALVAAACSGTGPRPVGSQPSWRAAPPVSTVPAPVRFAPSSEPARHYNEPAARPPPSALGDATIAAVRDAAQRLGAPVPVADARLFRACAELAAVVPEEGIIPYTLVEFALQRHGIIEPSPHLLVVWGDIDMPQLIMDQLQPRIAEILAAGATARVGIGAAKRMPDGTGAVVFALQGSAVTTAPIPRAVPSDGSFLLAATIDPSYREPEVFITRKNGSVERLELSPQRGPAGTEVRVQIRCGKLDGKQQVEITAVDAQGSTVLANFPVWCGVEPPLTMVVEPSIDDAPVADPREAERRVLALVNRDRQAAGLAPLLWDERVADVSRAHSLEMRTTKVVAHVSPTTGSAADRVRAAKIKTPVVLENVARAYGVGEAHQGLMNSPGHRANLLSSSATHVGIGIVFGEEVSGRRELFVTQVLTRIPPQVDPAAAVAELRRRLVTVRPVGTDPALESIAQELANGLAAGKTREQAYGPLKPRVDGLGQRFQRVGSVITAAGELDAIEAGAILGDAKPDDIGIGIAQGTHAELGDGSLFVVVLLGTRR